MEYWLKDVAETAAITLDALNRKAEKRGTVTHAD